MKHKSNTEFKYKCQNDYHDSRIKAINTLFPELSVRSLTLGSLRVTDGKKRLDLYNNRYFKVDTGERGNIYGWSSQVELISDYFELKPQNQ